MIRKLLSIRLRGVLFSILSGKDKKGGVKSLSKTRLVLFALVYLLVGISFFFIVFSLAHALAMGLMPIGASDVYFGLFFVISFFAIFMLSIFETKSELFECRDNDLLLSMPIKPRDIIISRITTVLFYNYLIMLLIAVPVIICFIINGGSLTEIIGSIFIFLTLPLMATSLSSGVGYAVHLFAARFPSAKNFATVAISLIFLAAYFVGYSYLINSADKFFDLENADALLSSLSGFAFFGASARFYVPSFVIYVVLLCLTCAVTLLVISKRYIGAIGSANAGGKRLKGEIRTDVRGVFSSMVRKEFSKFLTSPSYMLNCGLGLIFEIVIAIVCASKYSSVADIDPALLQNLGITSEMLSDMICPMILSSFVFCEAINLISASSLSLEGRTFELLKSLPIDGATVLFAKAAPNAILNVAASSISGIILSIAAKASLSDAVMYILLPSLIGVVFALVGISVNVLLPKFDFVNDVQVVKQSAATLVSMLSNLAITLVFVISGAIMLAFGLSDIALPILTLAALLLCVALYALLRGPLTKKYASL